MRTVKITQTEAGQRLDKYLHKYLPEATNGFLYKMIRKKNITLNEKRVGGSEVLKMDDTVELYLSEETIIKFQGEKTGTMEAYHKAYEIKRDSFVPVFENNHICIVEKPAGMLSQKAADTDCSLNEVFVGYLLAKGFEMTTFTRAVCNRLDRNTGGLVSCAKTLQGAQEMAVLFCKRALRKFYHCVVEGQVTKDRTLKGYLQKDVHTNQVTLSDVPAGGGVAIETKFHPLQICGGVTLLEVELVTGKTHQIRAHLASAGHPVVGDSKYGNGLRGVNLAGRPVHQLLLHTCRLEFPEMEGELADLSGKVIELPDPKFFGV